MKLSPLLFLTFLIISCAQNPQPEREMPVDPGIFRLIGEQVVPPRTSFSKALIGGLSGITRKTGNRYFVISDDGSTYSPARFFEVELKYDAQNFEQIVFHKLLYFRQEDSSFFPALEQADSISVDPESIRYDSTSNQIFWTSEGYIDAKINPMLLQAKPNGFFLGKTTLGERYMAGDATGPRNNGAFEGLTLVPNTTLCWLSVEYPLKQDGKKASYEDNGTPVRMILYDYEKREILKEYPYQLEKVFADAPLGNGGGNGVVEILYHRENQLLVLERAYVSGHGNYVRLYLADFSGATEISGMKSLEDEAITPARKQLILDLNQLGLEKIDNIEAFDWGSTLENSGNPTMIFVSDDNFNNGQITQFIAVERIKPF